MNPNRRCDSCQAAFKTKQNLTCRAEPPKASVIPLPQVDALGRQGIALQNITTFPIMQPDEYCMQWRPKFELTQ